MGRCRFLYDNLVTLASMISVSSLRTGLVYGPKKTGTGSATMNAAGDFSGTEDLRYTVEIDSVAGGAEIGQATFKWSDGNGSWNATGVTTSASPITLNNGVTVAFVAGSGDDFVLADRWDFLAVNLFNASKLIDWHRDRRYRSAGLSSPNTITIDLGSAQEVEALALWDHNLTDGATITVLAVEDEPGVPIDPELLTLGWADYDGSDPDTDYETLTVDANDRDITQAVNSAGLAGMCTSGPYVSQLGQVYFCTIDVTIASGQAPGFAAGDSKGGQNYYYAAPGSLTAGHHELTFTSSTDTLWLLFINSAASDWSATVSLKAVPSWGTPDYTETVAYHAETILHYLSSPQTYRYWRLEITDASNSDGFLEIGELYLGPYLELTANYRQQFQTPLTFLQEVTRTPYGVESTRFYNIQQSYDREFLVPSTDVDAVKDMLAACVSRAAGTKQPFYFNDDADSPNATAMVIVDGMTPVHRVRDYYAVALEMREVMTSV